MGKARREIPRRYRDIPGHASIDKAKEVIAETLGLPIDAIDLRNPSGRRANRNSTVQDLRDKWEKENS